MGASHQLEPLAAPDSEILRLNGHDRADIGEIENLNQTGLALGHFGSGLPGETQAGACPRREMKGAFTRLFPKFRWSVREIRMPGN